ncbi:cyclic nucleotide-binding domain-containing protein [Dinoroseobacter sp. S124A]|uniref:cyclic nucleotide-binding domain-containing protein n=1 Tax=Dinoroseobacter sp. S124A TaxID=3415128 RepID=UPI003C7C04FE
MNDFTTFAVADMAGLAGVFFYILSYFLLQIGVLASDRYTYPVLNLLAAGCVLYSLQTHFNLASALVQLSWIAISLLGITRLYVIAHNTRFSEQERGFLDRKLPGFPPHWARRVLNLAKWRDMAAGTTLSHQAEPVSHLTYLVDGTADVFLDGKPIAELGPGALIGEISCLRDSPASATVVLRGPARVMQIDARGLRQLCRRTQGLDHMLSLSFSHEIRDKLLEANRARAALDL